LIDSPPLGVIPEKVYNIYNPLAGITPGGGEHPLGCTWKESIFDLSKQENVNILEWRGEEGMGISGETYIKIGVIVITYVMI